MSAQTQKELEGELQRLRDAYWSYMLEHCEIAQGGSLFVKFHTDTRTKFEGHVNSRMKNYHREDPVKKEEIIIQTQTEFQTTKARKKYLYKLNKKLRKERADEIKRNIQIAEKRNRRIARNFLWKIYYKVKDKHEKQAKV